MSTENTAAALIPSRARASLRAEVTGPDGKTRNLGRIDNKWWAPRLWLYRYWTFPRIARARAAAEQGA